MTSEERIKLLLNHREADRVGIHDSFWLETVRNFQLEGMPKDIDPSEYFNFDIRAIGMEEGLQLPEETIEEKEDYRIYRDCWGMLIKKWKHMETTPQLLDFITKDREAWKKIKYRLSPETSRVNLIDSKKKYEQWRIQKKFVVIPCLDPFEATWRIIGPENQLVSLITDPEWIVDIYSSCTDLVIATYEKLWLSSIQLDGMWLYGDIAYKNAPLISPKMYRNYVMPFHKKICDAVHAKNGKVIFHTDGNVNVLIPSFIEAGFDCLQPLEVKAGMDIIELKKQYGKDLSFMGNIDVRFMQDNNLIEIEQEIQKKIIIAKKDGGYIYHSDHSIPPGTRLSTFKYILELVCRYGSY
ncbi:MAG: uroporphyrinogen decarboxylase family protein [bacterium]|nr:uroporphyrinogen decarboxylase family protein [bacterium]